MIISKSRGIKKMNMQNMIKLIAGVTIFTTSLLGFIYSKNWLFVTMFVGLNLFQYSLSGFCPLEIILKKFGVKD